MTHPRCLRGLAPLLAAAMLALAAGCNAESDSSHEATATAPPAAEAAEAAEPAMTEVPQGVCARLGACCRAFHEAENVDGSRCAPFDRMAAREDDVCEPTMAGYRRTLARDGLPLPEVCR